MICIYSITDPTDGEMLYIGMTKDFETRRYNHLHNSHNDMLKAHIERLLSIGVEPIFDIVEKSETNVLDNSESHYIAHFTSLGYKLYNNSKGNCSTTWNAPNLSGKKVCAVGITDIMFDKIKAAGRLKYMSFSAYVNKLIDADLTPNPHQ